MSQDYKNIIENFRNERWSNLSRKEKEDIIIKTIQYEQQKMSNCTIDGVKVKLSKFADIHISFDGSGKNMGYDVNGLSKGYKIYLNGKFFQDEEYDYQGIEAYTYLIHELQHTFQNFLIKESRTLFADKSLKDFVKPILISGNRNTKVEIFSIEKQSMYITKGNLRINPIPDDEGGSISHIRKISNIFYTLRKVEREAFLASNIESDKLIDMINSLCHKEKKLMYIVNCVTNQIMEFKKRYNCTHLHNQEVLSLIDKCFENIYLHKKPNNALEESVMYDISCVAAANKGTISTEECNQLLDEDIKSKKLINNPYTQKNDLQIKSKEQFWEYKIWVSKFGELSLEQQIKNTMLAINIASVKPDELKQYIIDIDTLKLYCLENIKEVLVVEGEEEGITNLFGREFYEDIKKADKKYPNASMDFKAYEAFKNLLEVERKQQIQETVIEEGSRTEEALIVTNITVEKDKNTYEIYNTNDENIEY